MASKRRAPAPTHSRIHRMLGPGLTLGLADGTDSLNPEPHRAVRRWVALGIFVVSLILALPVVWLIHLANDGGRSPVVPVVIVTTEAVLLAATMIFYRRRLKR